MANEAIKPWYCTMNFLLKRLTTYWKDEHFLPLIMTAGFIKLVKDMEEDGVEWQSNLEIVHCLQFILVMFLVSMTK